MTPTRTTKTAAPRRSYRDSAYGAISGLADLDEQLAEVARHSRETLDASSIDEAKILAADVRAALAHGTLNEIDITARLIETDAAPRIAVARHNLWATLRQSLQHERAAVLEAGRDAALAVLNVALGELLAEVRHVGVTLGAVSSAIEAIASGEPEIITAWQAMSGLVDRYDELRKAQHELHGDGYNLRQAMLRHIALVRRADDLDPLLRAERDHTAPPPAPWPSPDDRPDVAWWPTTDRATYLRWIATDIGDRAWVPTTEELGAEQQRIRIVRERAVADRAKSRGADLRQSVYVSISPIDTSPVAPTPASTVPSNDPRVHIDPDLVPASR